MSAFVKHNSRFGIARGLAANRHGEHRMQQLFADPTILEKRSARDPSYELGTQSTRISTTLETKFGSRPWKRVSFAGDTQGMCSRRYAGRFPGGAAPLDVFQ
jgi:hypothetical protein